MPDAGYLPSFLETFNSSAFAKLFESNVDHAENKMVTVYHSVPKDVMSNNQYRQTISQFGPSVKHVLDCPESNIPVLARSKATFFTDRIKMVCPLLFPTSYGSQLSLFDQVLNLETQADSEF
jgi:hypothetical protein